MTTDEYHHLGKLAIVRHIKTGEQHILKTRRMGGWCTTHHSRKPGKGGIHIDNYSMLEDYDVVSMDGAYCTSDLRLESFYQRDQRLIAHKDLNFWCNRLYLDITDSNSGPDVYKMYDRYSTWLDGVHKTHKNAIVDEIKEDNSESPFMSIARDQHGTLLGSFYHHVATTKGFIKTHTND